MKRLFDTLFSASVLICGAPIYLFISLLIKFSSKGPIFYACERVGIGGRTIHCWKFRSMSVDAEQNLKELLKNPAYACEWQTYRKLKNDPRITTIGHFLRKSSLDELPQFWNVLKGDLSIVGPRPAKQEEIEHFFGAKKDKILSVRPGITGLWQTSGRNQLSYEERVALEEQYVDLRSFFFDLKLILKTCRILFSKGAY